MTDWKGFTAESKSWMSYDGMTTRQKFAFWRQFPFAYFRFRVAFPLRDVVKTWHMRRLLKRDED